MNGTRTLRKRKAEEEVVEVVEVVEEEQEEGLGEGRDDTEGTCEDDREEEEVVIVRKASARPSRAGRSVNDGKGNGNGNGNSNSNGATATTKVSIAIRKKTETKRSAASKKAKFSSDEDEDDTTEGSSDIVPGNDTTTITAPRPVRAAAAAAATAATATNKPLDLSAFTRNPLLAHKWEPNTGVDIKGWHCSEKLDGVRAIWTGSKFISREGNPFFAPDWFTKRLPRDVVLDGELFTVRGGFQNCVSIVRSQDSHHRWKFSVTYQVFDIPSKGHLPFESRLSFLKDLVERKLNIKWVQLVSHQQVRDEDHVLQLLDSVTQQGGEGLMLREPKSTYTHGRSRSLLKVKTFHDADAIVRSYTPGTGKHASVIGALMCEMVDPKTGQPSGKMFKVGTGLTDLQRKNPPKIGAVIIYKYQELSNSGNPRFPSFVGERAD